MMSSRHGSCEMHNTAPGVLSYRCSKAALNMVMRDFATLANCENNGIIVFSMSPGWARTEMGGKHCPVSAGEAAETFIETLTQIGEKDHGQFIHKDGSRVPF